MICCLCAIFSYTQDLNVCQITALYAFNSVPASLKSKLYHLSFIIYLYNTFNYNSKVAQIAVQKYKITSKVTYNISNKHQIPNNSPTVLKASEKKKVF